MMEAVGDPQGRTHCDACFTGNYVVPVARLGKGRRLHA